MASPKQPQPEPQNSAAADPPVPPGMLEETKRPTDSVPMISGTFANLPMRFGRYQVEKLLGRGAMGAVYLARDTQLGRMVALKIPKLSGSGAAKLLQRLKTEAMAAALIDHPCLCAVYDTGEIDGTSFIAMQYIEGDTLKDVLEKQSKTPQEAVALVIHLAEGLAEAHAKGIYHRDLKPENIKLNRRGLPVIMDFGLAKLTTTLSTDAGKTQRGTILGSPAYMSPEQAGGKLEEIDHRSDLYALGVILFEMLTGQRPFSGSALQVMGQKSVSDAPSVLTIKAELDPQLAAVCDKMLARQRENRHQTAGEVVAALTALAGERPPTTPVGSSSSWNVVSPVLPGIPVFERDDEGTSSIITRPRKRRPPQRRASSSGMMAVVRAKCRSMADWWRGQSAALRWSVLGGTGTVLLFAAIVLSFRKNEPKDGEVRSQANFQSDLFSTTDAIPRMEWIVGPTAELKTIAAVLAKIKEFSRFRHRTFHIVKLAEGIYPERIVLTNSYPPGIRFEATPGEQVILKPAGIKPIVEVSGNYEGFGLSGIILDATARPLAMRLSALLPGTLVNNVTLQGYTETGILAEAISGGSETYNRFVLEQLDFRPASGQAGTTGILLKNRKIPFANSVIRQCRFFGPMAIGITLESPLEGVEIGECLFHQAETGILLSGDHPLLEDVLFTNNTFYLGNRGIVFSSMPAAGSEKLGFCNNLFYDLKLGGVFVEKGYVAAEFNDFCGRWYGVFKKGMISNWTTQVRISPTEVDLFSDRSAGGNNGKFNAKSAIKFISIDPSNTRFLAPNPISPHASVGDNPEGKTYGHQVGAVRVQ